eukprot:CAMPEP_0172900770 /NCGR_PEP_ID=MMETSP1075-20121228/164778_1 /TAXON_ID=2916 /ORGANISM="Ceratium fusus, Strain PA161109" /LENGTH=54 /DNA_ID=CAMNT_0013757023 /DNA_START=26 /DNA_END=187 /DNA_ORIENTATION=+
MASALKSPRQSTKAPLSPGAWQRKSPAIAVVFGSNNDEAAPSPLGKASSLPDLA